MASSHFRDSSWSEDHHHHIHHQQIKDGAVPAELKLWRRWSNQQEQKRRKSSINMSINLSCSSCGIADLEVRCRGCNTRSCLLEPQRLSQQLLATLPPMSRPSTPSEGDTPGSGQTSLLSTPTTDTMPINDISPISNPDEFKISEHDFATAGTMHSKKRPVAMFRPAPRWSPSEGAGSSKGVPQLPGFDMPDAEPVSPMPSNMSDMDDAIIETAATAMPYKPYRSQPLSNPSLSPPSPRSPVRGRRSPHQIASVRQSMIEAAKPPPRQRKWFERTESEQNMTFKFVLTPRGKGAKMAPPPADHEGRVIEASKPTEGPASSSSSSSKPTSSAPAGPASQISLADLARDPSAFQRLLACTMFMMNDVPDKDAAPKRLDLDLLPGRGGPGSFAMKHERKTDYEKDQMTSATKKVQWRISVR